MSLDHVLPQNREASSIPRATEEGMHPRFCDWYAGCKMVVAQTKALLSIGRVTNHLIGCCWPTRKRKANGNNDDVDVGVVSSL